MKNFLQYNFEDTKSNMGVHKDPKIFGRTRPLWLGA